MKYPLFALLTAGLLSACSKAPEAVNVQALNQDFISAWNNKDSGKITGFLADDVQFVQGSAHLKGKDEVAQKWVRETLPTLSDLKTSVSSSSTDEHTAYEAGTFSVDVLPRHPRRAPRLRRRQLPAALEKGLRQYLEAQLRAAGRPAGPAQKLALPSH